MIINNNVPARKAYNKLAGNVSGLKKSSEKLSSGYRINHAADDAAGLAISEKMRSQLRGVKQSLRNAQDGSLYIQTAEGALDSIHGILQRCKELAVESANGIYDNSTDRAALQLEYEQLRNEIDHTSMTDFNGIYVFDTTGATAPDAFGNSAEINGIGGIDSAADGAETIVKITLADGTDVNFSVCFNGIADIESIETPVVNDYSAWANTLSFGGVNVTADAIRSFANAIKTDYLPKLVGSIVAKLPNSSIPTVNGMGIGFELYNAGNNGVLAFVRSNGTTYKLAINTNYLTVTNGAIDFSDDLAGTVAHEMMHAIMFDTVTNGMLSIDPTTGRQDSGNPRLEFPHWFTEGLAETVGGGMDRLSQIMGRNNVDVSEVERLTTSSRYSNDVSISQIQTWMGAMKSYDPDGSTVGVGYSRGYAACMYLGYKAGCSRNLSTDVNATVIAKGIDNILTDIAAGHSLDSVIAHYTDFDSTADFVDNIDNAEIAEFVNQLIKSANIRLGTKMTGGSSFIITVPSAGSVVSPNGLSGNNASLLSGTPNNSYFILDINNDTYDNRQNYLNAGLSSGNIYSGGTTSVSGTNRDGNTPNGFAGCSGGTGGNDPADPDNPGGTGGTGGTGTDDPNDPSGTGETTKPVTKALTLQLGPRSKEAIKFTFQYTSDGIGDLKSDLCCSALGLGLDRLSISDQRGANKAIDRLDHAINKISCIRATFGAAQNRLEHKVNNLTATYENITEAESHIRDTDMANEMMSFTKYRILQNAAQTMLSQTMQLPQNVLSLLG